MTVTSAIYWAVANLCYIGSLVAIFAAVWARRGIWTFALVGLAIVLTGLALWLGTVAVQALGAS